MPDFAAPEYASYVELMRGLRLEREFKEGDRLACFWINDDAAPSVRLVDSGLRPVRPWFDRENVAARDLVWLPQLADWLDMLEADAVLTNLSFERDVFDEEGDEHRWGIKATTSERAFGETREEACARLWMAVTGRTVTTP